MNYKRKWSPYRLPHQGYDFVKSPHKIPEEIFAESWALKLIVMHQEDIGFSDEFAFIAGLRSAYGLNPWWWLE